MSRKSTNRSHAEPLLLPSARKAQGKAQPESDSKRRENRTDCNLDQTDCGQPHSDSTPDWNNRNDSKRSGDGSSNGDHSDSSSDHSGSSGDGDGSGNRSDSSSYHDDSSNGGNRGGSSNRGGDDPRRPQPRDRSQPLDLPLGLGVQLVAYHPCGLYVLDKPEGILSHPNKKAEIRRSLLQAPYSMQEECFYDLEAATAPNVRNPDLEATARERPAAKLKLYLLHRLDSATSGLLLLADNPEVALSVRTAFSEGAVHKTYLALCASDGRLRTGENGRWSDRLQRLHGGSSVHVQAGQGQSAVTDYICKKVEPHTRALALLELNPISGRTHQLRVHCAQHNLPIIGDGKYGDFRLNRSIAQATGCKRLFLHAMALRLSFRLNGETVQLALSSPPPPTFDEVLRAGGALAKGAAAVRIRHANGTRQPAARPQPGNPRQVRRR